MSSGCQGAGCERGGCRLGEEWRGLVQDGPWTGPGTQTSPTLDNWHSYKFCMSF